MVYSIYVHPSKIKYKFLNEIEMTKNGEGGGLIIPGVPHNNEPVTEKCRLFLTSILYDGE